VRVEALLADSAARNPDAIALTTAAGGPLTYGGLAASAERLAARLELEAGGEADGACVAVIAPNVPALVVGLFAVWQVGGVAVPLNARLREHELSRTLADARPVLVLSVAEHLGYSLAGLLDRLQPTLPSVRAVILLAADGTPGEGRKQQTVTSREPVEPRRLAPEMSALLYTSGTTGAPKGALVSHAREVTAPRELASVLALTPADTVSLVIAASHAFGLTCLLSALSAGAAVDLVESTTTLAPLLESIERGTTVLHGSPALFAMLQKARTDGFPGLRAGFVGGAPSPPELQRRLDELGILNLYGLTETGAVACCRPDDPPELRRTTAGRPIPGMEVRVHDGELQVRGVGVTPGYLDRPDETAAVFVDGWFRTGDVAELKGGYVRISGRLKELVHVSGFNVFPAEVEAVLLLHPDVVQAAVVGVPDERVGEVLRAFVVPREGSDLTTTALLQFARARIAGYKLPYAIRLLPELPLLPSGKPDRRALAAR
jgi:acyl-CoA synthetase (AMP-forming)/AMP-acid ligase II